MGERGEKNPKRFVSFKSMTEHMRLHCVRPTPCENNNKLGPSLFRLIVSHRILFFGSFDKLGQGNVTIVTRIVTVRRTSPIAVALPPTTYFGAVEQNENK